MMRRFLLFSVFTYCLFFSGLAQNVSITPDGNDPDPSAMLDIQATDKGLLIPRLSSVQRSSINSPAEGLLVYDTDSTNFYFFNGVRWSVLGSGNFSPSSSQTISISGTILSLTDGGSVDLSSIDTDTQLDSIAIANMGFVAGISVVNTDNQTLGFNNTTGELSISEGNSIVLPIASGGDNWGSQVVITDGVTFTGNGTSANPLIVKGDLSDNQSISLSGTELSISGGNTIDLVSLQNGTNTDFQSLSLSNDTIYLSNGGSVKLPSGSVDTKLTETEVDAFVANNGYLTSFTEADGSITNEIQDLSLVGNVLTITKNGTATAINLSPYLDDTDTDEQTLSLSGTELSISNGNMVDLASIAGSGGSGEFQSIVGVVQNTTNMATDDFVFGSTMLENDGSTTNDDSRFLFDKGLGAFRAGITTGNQWTQSSIGMYSLAIGEDNTASGYGSVALGSKTNAVGMHSFAHGQETNAGGDNSIAFGVSSTAANNFSFAHGQQAYSGGEHAVAIGNQAIAEGNYSVAIGNVAQSSGTSAVAIGEGVVATGYVSVALGKNTTAEGSESIASGLESTANGMCSIAMGYSADTDGDYAFAAGNNSSALGESSVAFGETTLAYGKGSFSMGISTNAMNYASVAFGENTTASGYISMAIGQNTTASATQTFAIGLDNTSSGDFSFSGGYNSRAEGEGSFVFGENSAAAGNGAVVFGVNNYAGSYGEFVIGLNSTSTPGDQDNFNHNDRVFTVGNGFSSSNPSDALVILKNGAVGIGTSEPQQGLLEIKGEMNGQSIFASHDITAANFPVISDRRVKNIQGHSNSSKDLETLAKIEITNYTFIDTLGRGKAPFKKVIAQQVKEVFPLAVKDNGKQFVPNIYTNAVITKGRINLTTDLQIDNRVKLFFSSEEVNVTVLEVGVDYFVVDIAQEGDVFVFGKEVSDFHTVDYDAISMLNVSATQELLKRIELLEKQNAQQESAFSKEVEKLNVKVDILLNTLQAAR